MLSLAAVLALLICAVNIHNYSAILSDADDTLDMLMENGGSFPSLPRPKDDSDRRPDGKLTKDQMIELSPEAPFDTRYFSVVLDKEGDVISVNVDKIAAVDRDDAAEFAALVHLSEKERGFVGNYRFLSKTDEQGRFAVIFLDATRGLDNFRDFLIASVTLSLAGLLMVGILVSILSGIVMKPFAELYGKQRRFITDAGHELKTPLTVISADCEMLKYSFGENEWTDAIKGQVSRLSELTEKLVMLSRMDEGTDGIIMTEMSLSEVVFDAASSYKGVCDASGKRLVVAVKPDVSVVGDRSMIKTMLNSLLDNAVKYSPEGGEISISLTTSGRWRKIAVKNSVESLPDGDLNLLFERFYRPDGSRSTASGGHGIGLSIAASVAGMHKGKITVASEDSKTITFTVLLPL